MFRKLFKSNQPLAQDHKETVAVNSQLEIAKKYFLIGVELLQKNEFEAAEGSFLQSLEFLPDRISTLSNLVTAQFKQNKISLAKVNALKAINIDANNLDVIIKLGLIELENNNTQSALDYLKKATTLNPNHAQAWSFHGLALARSEQYSHALDALQTAINLDPILFEPRLYAGMTLAQLGNHEEALIHFREAEKLNSNSAKLWINKAISLHALHNFEESLLCYQRGYSLEPDIDYLLGDYIHAKLLICDWEGIDELIQRAEEDVSARKKVASPFAFLSISDSPRLQKTVVELVGHSDQKRVLNHAFKAKDEGSRIKLGYFSADFYNHPVSYLTAELFELHDRSKFEIIAFNLSSDTHDDEMQTRLKNGFDQFLNVGHTTDNEISQLSRDLQIDIAIDLGGYTKNSRSKIFRERAAPLQINYLGFPGSMGADFMDYIIADKYLIPGGMENHYTEKIIYMPNCFQCNDSHRKISDSKFTKKHFDLPENAYIFCSFNNDYKFNPRLFQKWANILRNAPGSVLWLLASTTTAENNLRRAITQHGIDPNRLIFSGRLPRGEYLARFQLADLFLDTLPFNAGTTASDALWSGLPVLTQTGQSFAGRMATSILSNIGLNELIAVTASDYEEKAINLANNPQLTKNLKQKLAEHIKTEPLFDTQKFARNLEAGYLKIHQSWRAGLPPASIFVS